MLIVDRIEEAFAVCEDPSRQMRRIPLEQLPPGVREGDCLLETKTGYQIDREETNRRRKKNQALFRSLVDQQNGE